MRPREDERDGAAVPCSERRFGLSRRSSCDRVLESQNRHLSLVAIVHTGPKRDRDRSSGASLEGMSVVRYGVNELSPSGSATERAYSLREGLKGLGKATRSRK